MWFTSDWMFSKIMRCLRLVSLDATVSDGKRFARVMASLDLDAASDRARYRSFNSSSSSSNVTVCDCDMMFK